MQPCLSSFLRHQTAGRYQTKHTKEIKESSELRTLKEGKEMSEEKKRHYRRRPRRENTPSSDGQSRSSSVASHASTDSRTSNSSKTSNTSANSRNRRRNGNQNGTMLSKDPQQPLRSAMRQVPKEETRDNEIALLNHRISSVPEVKLINSTTKVKVYSATFGGKETYRLTVPILKRLPPQLQLQPDKPFSPHVIKNFNNKTKTNDKSLLFYFNLLVNDYHHLHMKAEDYKLYNTTKLLTTIEEMPTRPTTPITENTLVPIPLTTFL